ncbi:hypothetical protein BB560_006076, partial [Smittium megazygosporum]
IMISDILFGISNAFTFVIDNKVLFLRLLLVYIIYLTIYYKFFDRLSYLPGPWWAKFTSFPYMLQRVLGESDRFSSKLHKEYGQVVRVGPNEVSISNTRDLKIILSSYRYPKSQAYTNTEPRQSNIFTTRSEEMNRVRRRQIAPAFSKEGLASVEDLVMKVGILSLKKKIDTEIKLGNGKYVANYYKLFQNLTSDVISELAFGKSFNAIQNDGNEVIDWVHSVIIISSLKAIFPFVSYFPLVLNKLEEEKRNLIYHNFDAIENRRALMDSGKYKQSRKDILHMYLTSVNSDGKKLSYYEIISESIFMLVAGIDTTSVSMTWLLHFYTIYPEVYKKVLDEIDANFPDRTTPITYDQVCEKLKYFIATVYECLRMKPPVNGSLPRDSSSDGVQLSSCYIPKDVHLLLYTEGAHRNKHIWTDPEKFIPERFMGKGEKLKKELFAFSSGVRICPGRNLGLMEIYTVMTNLLRDYDFKLLPGSFYGPDNLDPSRGNEPYILKDKTLLTRIPINDGMECNIIVTHRQ